MALWTLGPNTGRVVCRALLVLERIRWTLVRQIRTDGMCVVGSAAAVESNPGGALAQSPTNGADHLLLIDDSTLANLQIQPVSCRPPATTPASPYPSGDSIH